MAPRQKPVGSHKGEGWVVFWNTLWTHSYAETRPIRQAPADERESFEDLPEASEYVLLLAAQHVLKVKQRGRRQDSAAQFSSGPSYYTTNNCHPGN